MLFPGCSDNLMAMSGGFLALQARKAKEKKKVAELEDAFKAADTDGDGKLSLHEWMEALKQSGHNVSRLDNSHRAMLILGANLAPQVFLPYVSNLRRFSCFLCCYSCNFGVSKKAVRLTELTSQPPKFCIRQKEHSH